MKDLGIEFDKGELYVEEDLETGEVTEVEDDDAEESEEEAELDENAEGALVVYEDDDEDEDSEEDDTEEDTIDSTDADNAQESDESISEENEVSVFATLAKTLRSEDGLLGGIEEADLDTIETMEDLQDYIAKDVKLAIDEHKEAINERSGGLIKFLDNGGDVKNFVAVHSNDDFSNIKEADLADNEELQRKVIMASYTNLGLSKERATRKLNRLVDLEEEALDSLPDVQEFSAKQKEDLLKKAEKEQQDAIARQQKLVSDITTDITTKTEFIPGKKLSKITKDKVSKSMATTWTEVVNNPEKYAPMLAYLKHYKLLDGDFSVLDMESTTKGTTNLKKVLNKKPKQGKSSAQERLAKDIISSTASIRNRRK